MKTNSSTLLSLFDLGPIEDFFILIKLELSTTYRWTSKPYNVVFNGETYVSNNALLSYESPRIAKNVDREVYRIKVSDSDNSFSTESNNSVTNSPITVWLGFTIGSVDRLGADETLLAYKGTINQATKDVDFQEGTNEMILEGASPMADLDSVFTFITSKNGMDQFSSTDTSFDDIFTGSKEIELKWGK